MNRRDPWKRALLKVAAVAGLLNLAACLGGRPAAPALPLVVYSPEFQQGAAVELAQAIDDKGACFAPHLAVLVVDYSKLRTAVREGTATNAENTP